MGDGLQLVIRCRSKLNKRAENVQIRLFVIVTLYANNVILYVGFEVKRRKLNVGSFAAYVSSFFDGL